MTSPLPILIAEDLAGVSPLGSVSQESPGFSREEDSNQTGLSVASEHPKWFAVIENPEGPEQQRSGPSGANGSVLSLDAAARSCN